MASRRTCRMSFVAPCASSTPEWWHVKAKKWPQTAKKLGLGHAIHSRAFPHTLSPLMPRTVLVSPVVPSSDVAQSTKHPGSVDLHVGHKIRDRRKELRLSQTDLGTKVGVSFQQLQKYENGTNRVGASRLAAIAKALGVPVGYFFPVDEPQKATQVDIAALIVDLQTRLSFVQAGLDRLGNCFWSPAAQTRKALSS